MLCPQGSRHPSALWAGDGRTRAIRRFFPKAGGGFAAQDIHCQAGALRRAATVRVPLDGVRWTEAPRGRPCPRQGARAGARTAPPRRAPPDPQVEGAQAAWLGSPPPGSGCRQCLPGTAEPFRPRQGARPGAFPRRPRRPGRIAPGISASFQFLPTSGGNQAAEGVQVSWWPEAKRSRTCTAPRSGGTDEDLVRSGADHQERILETSVMQNSGLLKHEDRTRGR